MLRALIFDVDGTLADTEAAHRDAFNEAFSAAGLAWHWDVALYTRLLEVAGGKERILHYWRSVDPSAANRPDAGTTVAQLHAAKTRIYERVAGGGRLALRPGILRLIRQAADQGMPVAIATTTTPANIDALLRAPLGATWRSCFAAVGDANTAARKKPDPQVYLQVLDALGLPAADCLAFEDSRNGLLAAAAAGIPTVITPTAFTADHDFSGALLVLPDLDACILTDPAHKAGRSARQLDLAALRSLHACTSLAAA